MSHPEGVTLSTARTALPVDLDEAAHRCLVAGFDGTTAVPDTLKRLIDRGLGAVILFTRNVRDAEQVRRTPTPCGPCAPTCSWASTTRAAASATW